MEGNIVELIVSLTASLFGMSKSFAFVKEGQLGSLTVFGKAVRRNQKIKVVKPGFVFLIPFVNTIQRAHIRMDSIQLNELNVTLANGLSYHYSAFVAYHVSDDADNLEKFLYLVENPRELISQKLSSEIREMLSTESDTEKVTGHEINEKLTAALKSYLAEKIGVTLDSCGLTSLTESAQAQQVKVTIAKMQYATEHYGEKGSIPETVVAACFGSTPVVSAPTVAQMVPKKKEEGFWEKLEKSISEEQKDE